MNRRIVTSLLAASALSGCIIESGDDRNEVLVQWSFLVHNDATGQSAAASCPAGFQVFVNSLPVGAPVNQTLRVAYDCNAGSGLSAPEEGTVDVWVEVIDPNNSTTIYARSITERVNASLAAPAAPAFQIQLEHGFYQLNWALFETVGPSAPPTAVSCTELETEYPAYDSITVGGTFTDDNNQDSAWGRFAAYECNEGAAGAIFYTEPAPVASVTELGINVVNGQKERISQGGCLRSSDNWDLSITYGHEIKAVGLALIQVSLDDLEPSGPECFYNLP